MNSGWTNNYEILNKIQTNYKNLTQKHKYIIEAVNFLQSILAQNYQSTLISFNGGKDATIVLVLSYLAILNLKNNSNLTEERRASLNKVPNGIYFLQPNPFPQMLQFYEQMKQIFNLQMHILKSKKYSQQLTKLSQQIKFQYTIMGSRKDDPYCEHLDLITQSDTEKGYPAFKRVNPIIKWDYVQVWQAIKALQIPYCILYEKGYSSIGNKNNTVKNPTLLCGTQKFKSPLQASPQSQRVCRISDQN